MYNDKEFRYAKAVSGGGGASGAGVGGRTLATGGPPHHQHQRKHPAHEDALRSAARISTAPNPNRAGSNFNVPHHAHKQGRIRVNAGDKCVAQAKGKSKRRKAVPGAPVDLSCLSMDSIAWSDDHYTVQRLVTVFGRDFPVIVKVVADYTGAQGRPLSTNQVLILHSFGHQKRVFAQDTTGAKLSIPGDYPMDVYRVTDGVAAGERLRFRDLMDNYPLPQKLEVGDVEQNANAAGVSVIGEQLRVSELQTTVFLRANTIIDGWVDELDIHIVSEFMGLKFAVALGMNGASDEEWRDYYGMYARSVRHLKYERLVGFGGILEDDQAVGSRRSTSTLPASISPVLTSQANPIYENIYKDTEKEKERERARERARNKANQQDKVNDQLNDNPGNTYENWNALNKQESSKSRAAVGGGGITRNTGGGSSRERPVTLDTQPVVQVHRSDDRSRHLPDVAQVARGIQSGYQSPGRGKTSSTSLSPRSPSAGKNNNNSSRPETSFSDADENELEGMFRSVIEIAEGNPQTPSNTDSKNTNQGERREIRTREWAAQAERDSAMKNEQEELRKKFERRREIMQEKEEVEEKAPPSKSNELSTVGNISFQVQKANNTKNQTRGGGSTSDSPVPATSTQSKSDRALPHAVVTPTVKSESPFVVTVTIEDTIKKDRSKYASQPNLSKQDINSNHEAPTSSSTGEIKGASAIGSIDEVPSIIDGLTVEDVCRCLELMNMDEHVDKFRRKQVDGNLLSVLKETVLQNEFSFTPFNSSKLMRFVRGWRPKLT